MSYITKRYEKRYLNFLKFAMNFEEDLCWLIFI